MDKPTLKERILELILTPYYYIEFYFANRWLNKHFGYHEFWGDIIQDLVKYIPFKNNGEEV